MSGLYFKNFYKHMGLFLLLFMIYPLFFLGDSEGQSSKMWSEVWNIGHFIFFGLFGYFLDNYFLTLGFSRWRRFGLAVLIFFLIGGAIEVGQLNIVDRYFSWSDLVKDVLGGSSILIFKLSLPQVRSKAVTLQIVSILLVVIAFVPLAGSLYDEFCMKRDFPLLSGFESRYELSRWTGRAKIQRERSVFRRGQFSGKISLTSDKYSGVSLRWFLRDWSNYRGFAFSVFNPGASVLLHFRIDDKVHQDNPVYSNRYNGTALLQKGWNDIEILMEDIKNGPRERFLDVVQVRSFGIFVMELKENRVLYLDEIRLLYPSGGDKKGKDRPE